MALSFQQIREQLCAQALERWGYSYYVRDIYDEYVILEEYSEGMTEYCRADYTKDEDAGSVMLGEGKQKVRMMVEYLPLAEAFGLREAGDADGWQWQVVLIQPGLSKNKTYYPAEVLREASALFEGVRALARSDEAHLNDREKRVENVVGWFDAISYVESVGLVGTFHITADADWLRLKLRSAWDQGKSDLIGFSIVASGTGKRQLLNGELVTYVEAITHAEFVDTVVNPAAGGRILALVASEGAQKGLAMLQDLLRLLEAQRPDLYGKIDAANITEQQILALLREAVIPPVVPPPVPPAAVDPMLGVRLAESQRLIADAEQRLRLTECRLTLRDTLSTCNLPPAARNRVQTAFQARLDAGQVFTEGEITSMLDSERHYLGQLHTTGVITGFGPQAAGFRLTEAEEDKWPEMLDNFFDWRNPERKGKVVHSFKECYISITGDTRVTGLLREAHKTQLREAISTTTFDQVFADALLRQMLRDYTMLPFNEWRSIVNIVPATSFRTLHRIRLGGYANLPAVSQGAAYAALTSPTDDEATYAVTKRGGTEDVTREAILNDDVGAIRAVPMRLAQAAKRTLFEFVFDFFRTNPTIYDAVALFHATHGNLTTTAFDAAGVQWLVHRQQMRDQTELSSSKPLGLTPAYLIGPNELETVFWNAFNRDTNNDPKFAQQVRPRGTIVCDYFTDANNWYSIADPMMSPGIEIAFLNGNEEPELFVQDMPEVGSMFTNDRRTYKIRHEYGGAVVEYRSIQGAVVA
jgi:hypothetical protein